MDLEGVTTELHEGSRTYVFPGNETIRFEKVVELTVRPSGSHRLKTADGRLHIVTQGWLAVSIEDDSHDWTV